MMSSTATAALAAARRVTQQAQGQHAQCWSLVAGRGFCSTSAAAASSGSRLLALHQTHVGPVQQLISLRRYLSTSPSASAAMPGAVPGTAGGMAEKQTGAGTAPTAGSGEESTGAASGPSTGGAEASTGLGMPGQTAPAEAGTGLRDPRDAPATEQHEGASTPDDAAAAERTAGPQQPPEGSAGSVGRAPQPPDAGDQQAEAGAAAGGSGHGSQSESDAALGGSVGGSPSSPDSEGEGPVKAEAQDEQGVMQWMIETIQQFVGQLSVRVLQRNVETGFNEQDFLESAKDAYWMVNDLFANRDFETLAPIVSEKLLSAFRDTHEEYEQKGYVFRLANQSVDEATITEITTLPKEVVAKLDPPMAALAPDSEPPTAAGSGAMAAAAAAAQQNATLQTDWKSRLNRMQRFDNLFLVIGVRFQGIQELETREKEGGKVLSLLTDKRSHVWRFIRGPLPFGELPVRQLDLPWKVLDVVT